MQREAAVTSQADDDVVCATFWHEARHSARTVDAGKANGLVRW